MIGVLLHFLMQEKLRSLCFLVEVAELCPSDPRCEILALQRLELAPSRTKLNQTRSATAGGSFATQEHRWDQLASKYVSVATEKHREQQ